MFYFINRHKQVNENSKKTLKVSFEILGQISRNFIQPFQEELLSYFYSNTF